MAHHLPLQCGLAALTLAAVPAGPAAAQTPAPCQAAEQRQFDFWVGRWTVFDTDGSKAGENTIERLDDGCALLERWRGVEGMTGTSLNSWSATTRQWHQHWVDNRGGLLRLAGTLQDKDMVLLGSGPGPARRDRIAWTPAADGSVRQHWERSEDGGATWKTVFDGRYVRQR